MGERIDIKILKIIILTYPLLDILYTVNSKILHVNVPINQALRVLIMLFLFSFIKEKKRIIEILIIALLLIIGELVHSSFGIISLIDDISYISKILFFIIAVFGIEAIIKKNLISSLVILELMVNSSIIICASIILSKFGLGFNSWGDSSLRTGVKGLFAVQNTINVTLLILLPVTLLLAYETKKNRYIFYYFLIFLSLILIGTKSGLVGASLITVIQFIYIFFKTKFSYLKMAIASFSIPLIILILSISKNFVKSFIQSQTILYNSYGYTNIFSFLISNRDLQIEYLKNFLSKIQNSDLVVFWGLGNSLSNSIINAGKADFKSIEMDFYGIYYYSGILILLIISIILLKYFFYSVLLAFKTKFSFFSFTILLSLSVGIFHSYFGGHVIYEALTSLYFGGLLAIVKVSYHRLSISENNILNEKRIVLNTNNMKTKLTR